MTKACHDEANWQKASCHTLKASSRRERRLKRFRQLASPMKAPQGAGMTHKIAHSPFHRFSKKAALKPPFKLS